MGGLDRHGIIVSGSREEITREVRRTLQEVSGPFVVGADCTLPSDVKWENIRTAIDAAHSFRA
jgi:uroporphyrinogen decarboxylase